MGFWWKAIATSAAPRSTTARSASAETLLMNLSSDAYLAGKGLADTRMKTISYGEDKPAVEGNNEEAWRQNRRGVPVPMRMPRR